MDTHLKERLVGAAVLVAVAVILIPEMLSGPAERKVAPPGTERQAGDEGVRTYTIDLGNRARSGADASAAPAAEPAAPEVVAAAPPPETEAEAVEALPEPAPSPAAPPAVAQAALPPTKPAPAPVAEMPVAAREGPATPVRQTEGQKSPWAVQVGSFAAPATAERLSQDLRRKGYDTFVVPFKSGSQTLYRVRIGPMQERAAADAAAQKLKREGTNATVVSNS